MEVYTFSEARQNFASILDHDRVQLYAQALCLEEMFQVSIPEALKESNIFHLII
ncbi:MAG: hypothetical protein L3J12_07555 [Spirochaetales bacterium]|nr:hypothetical protein [Spirochaetales bacterium]